MLKSISCEKLVKSPLIFDEGLNIIIGADNAHNSIGKSSVLMLIDYAFGGSDFIAKCDDVMKNVGEIQIGVEFKFDKNYSFIINTGNTGEIYYIDRQCYISKSEYLEFLKQKYFGKGIDISMRNTISGFFRIYQRNNYDDFRPLDLIKNEKWISIRKRVLKLFNKYWMIVELEEQEKQQKTEKENIKGSFNSGAVKKITKRKYKKNSIDIEKLLKEIEIIKETLKKNITDVNSIINTKNIELKVEKDKLVDHKLNLELKLSRNEANLSGNIIRTKKNFKEVVQFFPEINEEKLFEVERFHINISKILKEELEKEKIALENQLELVEGEIAKIDKRLLDIVNSEEKSKYLLEKLMELDGHAKQLIQQNKYWERDEKAKEEIKKININIKSVLEDSIKEIEKDLNTGMKKYIEIMYPNNPILPQISLNDTDYKFDKGDDRGTGKGYANLIALDLSFLEKTILPCIIHDSILFKNMSNSAIENLIEIYDSFKKQIFIAIDEIPKYSNETQKKIRKNEVLKLNGDILAFNKRWKEREQ